MNPCSVCIPPADQGALLDLNRENIDTFDVREFYVELVSDLKRRGF